MNIIVTGATGFIGQNLIRSLKQMHSVHAIIRPTTDRTKVGTDNIFVFNDNIEVLSQYIIDNRIEGVIHLASLYISEHKSGQIKDLILSNVYFSTALLEACTKANVKWFINTGTIWQNYNAASGVKEYSPVNLYAATKQSFIDIAKFYTETTDMKFCTLKLCDTYGPGDTRRKIFNLFKQIAETGETLDMSPGDQKLDLLYIDDVVSGFTHLAEMLHNAEQLEDEYVLTSGEHHTLKEFANIFSEVTGMILNINWGRRQYRKREVMIPWQGAKLIGWKRKISLENGIRSLM